ncbi:hypothetical protein PPERSA_07004 [Pseudocohnilembus persalinus]|uniref:EF-hand domain-containing protein n=1 Tax=Pseudocohnilembus persalinus TaxID=266149 RepID=A0A0V0QZ97_PSEPJ|nr:hypothetical protein PPERSA_07004 [Pseudocohnilembus persalinus]|eukprot:KRX07389.1 hypothetical protein PPERSA_07004 [Pseudocohnilembus persalinus]
MSFCVFKIKLWVRFNEKSGTRIDGGTKFLPKSYFKAEMIQYIKEDKVLNDEDNMAQELVEALFQRFKSDEKEGEPREEIDIQDLMIAFTILSRMKDDQKLKEIFKLTDIDGDDCLSIEDIRQMIRRIERVFSKEMVHIENDSSILLNEMALIQAERKFNQTVYDMGKEQSNEKVDQDEDKFISWAEFKESLDNKKHLKAKFLPNNFQLANILEEKNLSQTQNLNRQRNYQNRDYLANQNQAKGLDFKCNPIKEWKKFNKLKEQVNTKKMDITQKKTDNLVQNEKVAMEYKKNEPQSHNKLNLYQSIVKDMKHQSQREYNQEKSQMKLQNNI